MNKAHLQTLAHDIRNPLASILSSVEMLRTQTLPPHDVALLLKTIEDKVYVMSHVLDTLYDIPSQVSSQRQENVSPGSIKSTIEHGVKERVRTILLVDDNQTSVDVLAELLRMRGHIVSVAYSGGGAHEQINKVIPDVLVLDIGLPDIDGYELLRSLRQIADVPVAIALTGYDREEDRQQAVDAGFNYYLRKPISAQDLDTVIWNAYGEDAQSMQV